MGKTNQYLTTSKQNKALNMRIIIGLYGIHYMAVGFTLAVQIDATKPQQSEQTL